MIDLGRMKVPIIEDKEGNATWSLKIDDISVSEKEVGLNYIDVDGYSGDNCVFQMTTYASGKVELTLSASDDEWETFNDKDDYTSFIMAMSIAREYAVEQLHKAMKDEASK
jgi:hypothetical protein